MTRFRNLLFGAALVAVAVVTIPASASAQTAAVGIEGAVDQGVSSTASRVSVGAAGSASPEIADPEDFYYRAGMLVDWPSGTRFLDKTCGSTSPAALYGCGDGIDAFPLGTYGDFGTIPGFELGIGRVAASSLRLEVVLSYRPGISFEGRANFLQTTERQDVSTDLTALSGMLVAYADLPGFNLPRLGSLRPFVGAGGGLSRIEVDATRMEFPRTTTIVPGGQRVNFAWMLAAGIAAPVGERATVELAWRYTDHGVIETGRGNGRIVWRDGSRAPLELELAETRAGLRGHGLALSLRFPF